MKKIDYINEFEDLLDAGYDEDHAYGIMISQYGDADDMFDAWQADISTKEWDSFQDWFEALTRA